MSDSTNTNSELEQRIKILRDKITDLNEALDLTNKTHEETTSEYEDKVDELEGIVEEMKEEQGRWLPTMAEVLGTTESALDLAMDHNEPVRAVKQLVKQAA